MIHNVRFRILKNMKTHVCIFFIYVYCINQCLYVYIRKICIQLLIITNCATLQLTYVLEVVFSAVRLHSIYLVGGIYLDFL